MCQLPAKVFIELNTHNRILVNHTSPGRRWWETAPSDSQSKIILPSIPEKLSSHWIVLTSTAELEVSWGTQWKTGYPYELSGRIIQQVQTSNHMWPTQRQTCLPRRKNTATYNTFLYLRKTCDALRTPWTEMLHYLLPLIFIHIISLISDAWQ